MPGAVCPVKSVPLVLVGILDQSAVWVDEMNYYDMRTDRSKGIPPLSLRPANPLGIEIEKWVLPPLSCPAFHVLKSFMCSGSRNLQGSTTEDASVVGNRCCVWSLLERMFQLGCWRNLPTSLVFLGFHFVKEKCILKFLITNTSNDTRVTVLSGAGKFKYLDGIWD